MAKGIFMNTKHASIRQQQRGISDLQVLLLEIFGEQTRAVGQAFEITISKRRRAEIVQALDKTIHKALIVSQENGAVITAINRF